MSHRHPHPLAGQTVKLRLSCLEGDGWGIKSGDLYRVVDYFDRLGDKKSWLECDGHPKCLDYAVRVGQGGLPRDDEVLYGLVDGFWYLVHVIELDGPSEAVAE